MRGNGEEKQQAEGKRKEKTYQIVRKKARGGGTREESEAKMVV